MDRRSFLKAVGIGLMGAAGVPLVLAAKEPTAELVLAQALIKASLKETHAPYYIICHPDQLYRLKTQLARNNYKHIRWVERYNRWRASRGEPPYTPIEPEFGTTGCVRWVGSEKIDEENSDKMVENQDRGLVMFRGR